MDTIPMRYGIGGWYNNMSQYFVNAWPSISVCVCVCVRDCDSVFECGCGCD